jgi:hypothetical protein
LSSFPINQKVADWVYKAVKRDPKINATQMFDHARSMDETLGGLNLRQFHASYNLPARRKLAREAAGNDTSSTKTNGGSKTTSKEPKNTVSKRATAGSRGIEKTRRETPSARTDVRGLERTNRIKSILRDLVVDTTQAKDRDQLVGIFGSLDEYAERISSSIR